MLKVYRNQFLVTVFQSSYRYAFPSFQAQWKITACKAFIKNKLGKKQIYRLHKLSKQSVHHLSVQRPYIILLCTVPSTFIPFLFEA